MNRLPDAKRMATACSGPDDRAERSLTLELVSTTIAVRHTLTVIRNHLCNEDYSVDFCGTAEIALAEAMNNVVRNAYPGQCAGMIRVLIHRKEFGIACEILDHGRPFPQLTLPEGRRPSLNVARNALPEDGFGWFLIRKLTHDVRYRRIEAQNHLCFSISETC